MSDQVRERIQERVDLLKAEEGASPRSISLASGMSADAIRDIFRKPDNSITLDTLRKLAIGLKTTPEWLAFGLDEGVGFGHVERSANLNSRTSMDDGGSDLLEIATTPVDVAYGGTVEAGSFRTVEDFDDFEHLAERPQIRDLPDEEYPHLPLTAFDVAGDSMNALKPRPIMPGDRVVAIPFMAFQGSLAIRDGMVVVVEQTLDGGHHRERSCKQVELYDDRIEFHPRSTNRKHRPIVVPRTVFTDPSEGDGREVNVLAVCRRVSNRLPL